MTSSFNDQPRRHWYRFSLRTLLIVTTLVGCSLGWLMREIRRGRDIEATIRTQSLGDVLEIRSPPAPNWLRAWLGELFLATVRMRYCRIDADEALDRYGWIQIEEIELTTKVTDVGLGRLQSHPEIERVTLELSPHTTAAGLREIKHLPKLTSLTVIAHNMAQKDVLAGLAELNYAGAPRLAIAGLADADLANIARMHRLTSLSLRDCTTVAGFAEAADAVGITDAGLKHLARLTNLNLLDLTGTSIAGPGLADLRGLKELARLNLSRTTIEGAGLAHLGSLHNLTRLNLMSSSISDEQLAHLPNLPRLTSLILYGTCISDAGLATLAGRRQLSYLNVEFTSVTAAAVHKLALELPGCHIRQDPSVNLVPQAANR